MKTKISAQIVAHSVNEQGDELISVLATFPRIILAEVNTHRMLSKNTSSSRAIPFNKMVETIQNDPFIPIAWQKEHKGMQGSEYFENTLLQQELWLEARDSAVDLADRLNSGCGVTKQLCNRLLEPFMWTTMLITGSKEGWDNFFELRCPQYSISDLIYGDDRVFKSKKDLLKELDYEPIFPDSDLDWLKINKGQAEIHMMDLAEKIYDAMNESTPKELKAGDWHIPFKDKIEYNHAKLIGSEIWKKDEESFIQFIDRQAVKVSVAMAARTSYTVVGEEKEVNYEAMIKLHDRLLAQDPPHSSPLEHCARVMNMSEYESFYRGQIGLGGESGWCNNFKGFIPYRYMVDNAQL